MVWGCPVASGREDGCLSFPFCPIFRGFLPFLMGWVVADKSIFDSGEDAPVFGMSVSVGFFVAVAATTKRHGNVERNFAQRVGGSLARWPIHAVHLRRIQRRSRVS